MKQSSDNRQPEVSNRQIGYPRFLGMNRQSIVRSLTRIVRSSLHDICAKGKESPPRIGVRYKICFKGSRNIIPIYVTPFAECVYEDFVEYGSAHLSEALLAWLDSSCKLKRTQHSLALW